MGQMDVTVSEEGADKLPRPDLKTVPGGGRSDSDGLSSYADKPSWKKGTANFNDVKLNGVKI